MHRSRNALKYGSSTRARASAFSSAAVSTWRGSPITRLTAKQASRTASSRIRLPLWLRRYQKDQAHLFWQAGLGDRQPLLRHHVGGGQLLTEAVNRIQLLGRRAVVHWDDEARLQLADHLG